MSEFATVIDAVESAVKIQEELKGKNNEVPEHWRIEFQIGVHYGDVIEDEDRIYGDSVSSLCNRRGKGG